MSSSANGQQITQAFQSMGGQFSATTAAQASARTEAMNQDLQRILAASKAANKQASVKAPSKAKSHKDGFEEISRSTKSLRKSHAAQVTGRHIHKHDQPLQGSQPVHLWRTQGIVDEPWTNIGQVKGRHGQHSPTSSLAASGKRSSTATTKGSDGSARRH